MRFSFTVALVIAGAVPGALLVHYARWLLEAKRDPVLSIVAFEPPQYQVRQETNHFRVEVRVPFRVMRPGENTVPLFGVPVHLPEAHIEFTETNLAGIVTVTNRLGLFVQRVKVRRNMPMPSSVWDPILRRAG